jgi:hypothetical protein
MAPSSDIVPNVHSSIDSSNKTLLKSDALYTYILDTTVFPREHECMRELRLVTDKHPWYLSSSTSPSAVCMHLLVGLAASVF